MNTIIIDSSNTIIDNITTENQQDKNLMNRCNFPECNKKLKITDLECRCGKQFCQQHKFPEQHMCEYDYKDRGKRNRLAEMMKCTSNKIQKI